MAPNIVLVMTDTQGANCVGAYGDAALGTPGLDRLAAAGARCDRAYTTCPVCTPARAGLFTGLLPPLTGAFTNCLALGADVPSMGQHFQALGYDTAYIGKWHLDGHDYFGTGHAPPGWDPAAWYDGRNYLDELGPEATALWRRSLGSIEALREHRIDAGFTWAHRCADRALDWMGRRRQRPFLLVVSYDEPHHPFTCPPEYPERFRDFALDLGPAGADTLAGKPRHQREWSAHLGDPQPRSTVRHPLYFGCNSFVDGEIARVCDAALGRRDTIVVYTADHGDFLGAHRLQGKGPALYDSIARIPLLVAGPGIPAGRVLAEPVSHLDVLPTLMGLAGAPPPPSLHGQDLARRLRGEAEAADRVVPMCFDRYEVCHDAWGGYQPIRGIVAGEWKLVINLHSDDELYHHASDPGEVVNRIADPSCAAERDRLPRLLLDELDRVRDPARGACWERRPWAAGRSRAWGGWTRPHPQDGFRPDYRDYDTGTPTRGVHREYA